MRRLVFPTAPSPTTDCQQDIGGPIPKKETREQKRTDKLDTSSSRNIQVSFLVIGIASATFGSGSIKFLHPILDLFQLLGNIIILDVCESERKLHFDQSSLLANFTRASFEREECAKDKRG
jgi:hypothetical protein